MTTPFMVLDLPTPTVTFGPLWATMLNASFDIIDAHDHSAGKGLKVKPNGLNINADLDIQNNNLLNTLTLRLSSTITTPINGPANTYKIYSVNGDLYFTNGAGAAIQITSGGNIVTSPGVVQVFTIQNISSDFVIGPADNFVELRVDTSVARFITLPLAAAVATGRIYKIKDITGLADINPITIIAAGADAIDGEATLLIDFTRGSFELIGNGASMWDVT